MIERPILFKGPLVRAILGGQKTQTRRLVKPQPDEDGLDRVVLPEPLPFWHDSSAREYHCPYGVPGDRLWVRETWRTFERPEDGRDGVLYFADGAFVEIPDTREAADLWIDDHKNGRHGGHWRPSIYMRRWASRITLEVAGVRAQRLQDISEEDARAEGVSMVPFYPDDGLPLSQGFMVGADDGKAPLETSAVKAFAKLWDAINGVKAPWSANPWVWAISFRRIEQKTTGSSEPESRGPHGRK